MTSRRELFRWASLAVLAVVSTPGARGAAPAVPPAPDLRTARVVDLTHPFDERTPYWPTATRGFELAPVHYGRTEAGYFYSAYSFCAPEHGGTHLDAPIHFGEGRWTADQIPVERLVRPAVVIDVAAASAADADHRLTADELQTWEARHGRIAEGTIVLLRTGWSARWPDKKRYLGDDTPGDASRLHFPSYGAEAARILVADRKVAALIDGTVVFSDETVWDPYYKPDPQYHVDGIMDSLTKAAVHLPRVDAIGGSAAGVYVNNRRIADPQARIKRQEAIEGRLFVLRKGQKQNFLVRLT